MVAESILYVILILTIILELEIEKSRKKINDQYIVEENLSPMVIRNDNGVNIYVELKKIISKFLMYLLCITTMDKSTKELMLDGDTKVVVCVERMKSNALTLAIVESKTEYSLYVPEIKLKTSLVIVKIKK